MNIFVYFSAYFKAFGSTFKNGLRSLSFVLYPKLIELFRIKTLDEDGERFIINLVQKTVDHREKNEVSRKDFFQLLIQLRNTGKIQMDGEWDTEIKGKSNWVSQVMLTGWLNKYKNLFYLQITNFCPLMKWPLRHGYFIRVALRHLLRLCRFAYMNWRKIQISKKNYKSK